MDIFVPTQSKRGSVLVDSRPDDVLLCDALDYRYRELCALHGRVTGEALFPPEYLLKDMILWREMRCRHLNGDHRHTRDELMAVRRIAQWSVDEKCKLCKQPKKILEWDD